LTTTISETADCKDGREEVKKDQKNGIEKSNSAGTAVPKFHEDRSLMNAGDETSYSSRTGIALQYDQK
jgi:hypothetical protein